jgi:hypothetical protein
MSCYFLNTLNLPKNKYDLSHTVGKSEPKVSEKIEDPVKDYGLKYDNNYWSSTNKSKFNTNNKNSKIINKEEHSIKYVGDYLL